MKKFQFKLEIVLKLKQNKEEECRIALGQVISEIEKTKRRREEAYEAIAASNMVGNDNFQFVVNYCQRLNYDIEQCNATIIKLEEKRKVAQEKYIEAANQLKAYEKLRDKQELAYKKEMKKSEAKMMDEMNQFRQNGEINYGR